MGLNDVGLKSNNECVSTRLHLNIKDDSFFFKMHIKNFSFLRSGIYYVSSIRNEFLGHSGEFLECFCFLFQKATFLLFFSVRVKNFYLC